jgi:hypothetical protein
MTNYQHNSSGYLVIMFVDDTTRTIKGPNKKKILDDQKFGTFIYKVLKQMHPNAEMSENELEYVHKLIRFSLEKIMATLNKKIVSPRDIQTVINLVLPEELAKHAVNEGNKAVMKYKDSKKDIRPNQKYPDLRSFMAGLVFPVTQIENMVADQCKTDQVAIYLTAVLEYLTAEILELAGNKAQDDTMNRITYRHIVLAIQNDEELNEFYHSVLES